MYNDIELLKSFLIEMAHDIEVEDEDFAEDLRKLSESLNA